MGGPLLCNGRTGRRVRIKTVRGHLLERVTKLKYVGEFIPPISKGRNKHMTIRMEALLTEKGGLVGRPNSANMRAHREKRQSENRAAKLVSSIDRLFVIMQAEPVSRDIPLIDVSPLVGQVSSPANVAQAIARACREYGFFYVTGHGVSEALQERLDRLSEQFFAQSTEEKNRIAMSKGGRAWRGYFAVGDELTSGRPDIKEGIYFGTELMDDHPMVVAKTPMHGRNLFPDSIPGLKEAVLEYMEALTRLGHALMRGVGLSLGLEENYFFDRYTADPLILFRIFNYPPPVGASESFGVGEHTDYGLLTILRQDMCGGLEIKCNGRWIAAPPIENTFVCNIGDMLDRMTGGRYLSTPHRVRNISGRNRRSFAFFFDPNFNAEVKPIALASAAIDNREERWDKASVHEFSGTYGGYLLAKVSKVFPELRREVL